MIVGILKETFPGEARVALNPASIPPLAKAEIEVCLEAGAGDLAGIADAAFAEKGAKVLPGRGEVFARSDLIVQVRGLGANPEAGRRDLELFRSGQVLVAQLEPLSAAAQIQELAAKGLTAFSLELMPRITRAQSMDVLSSMATIAGYKAVLLAASELPRMFPLLMTAAGTVSPARVFVIGAGVAGLQAIATARRLGALVEAYDVRPAVREQVESLGAKFVELPLEAGDAQDKGGYAKAQDEEFYRRQRDLMAQVISGSDVVVTTAAVPGRKSPVLITEAAVRGMPAGGVIVDLAAERGGNCELTKADQRVEQHGVTILGPTNLPATVPFHASQLFARNVTTFLVHLVKEGTLRIDLEDEITRETLVCRGGQVVHERIRGLLGTTSGPGGGDRGTSAGAAGPGAAAGGAGDPPGDPKGRNS